uniref:Secreted protein n=1 Tax=Romanomermis culicivorax TaxID=13658 RepID=A0A915K497_ROMCU
MLLNRKMSRISGVFKAALTLHGIATAVVTNLTALGKTNVKYDWLHVTCTEIRLVTTAVTVAVINAA